MVRIRCFSRFVGLPFHLLLPLISAIGYVIGALLLKRASDLGADVWRSTRIINYTQALMAAPLWLLGGTIQSSSLWWQPAIGGLLFFAGQVFTLLALTTGDVSVATPVLGVKILLVALLSTLLIGDPIGARLWTAAALSSVAIALLNISPGQSHRRVGTTILLAAIGAGAYACFDVLVQKWSPVWGTGRFLPIVMACGAAYSLPLRRFEGRTADRCVVPTLPPPPSLRRVSPQLECVRRAKADRSAPNRAPTSPGSPPAPHVSPCKD